MVILVQHMRVANDDHKRLRSSDRDIEPIWVSGEAGLVLAATARASMTTRGAVRPRAPSSTDY